MGGRNATKVWLTGEDASCCARILLKDILPLNPNWRRQDSWSYFPAMGKRDTSFVDDPGYFRNNSALNEI
jgi:hypothetical protein